MKNDRYTRLILDIENDFKDHIATVKLDQEGIYILRWQKPGTWINFVEYILRGSTLFVWGDLGDAVYQWSSNISLSFLAGCNVDYFREKCQASEEGRGFKYWWHEDAEKYLEEMFKEDGEVDDDTRMVFIAHKNDILGACQTRDGWHEWLRDYCNENIRDTLFGSDWWEYIPEIGIDAHPRCVMHLHGLKMAYRQLGAKNA